MAQIPKQELDAAVKKALDSQAAAKDKEVTPTVDLLLELRADLLDIAAAAGHDRDGVEVLYQVPQRGCCTKETYQRYDLVPGRGHDSRWQSCFVRAVGALALRELETSRFPQALLH